MDSLASAVPKFKTTVSAIYFFKFEMRNEKKVEMMIEEDKRIYKKDFARSIFTKILFNNLA